VEKPLFYIPATAKKAQVLPFGLQKALEKIQMGTPP
jgi:hypothetical protein